MKLKRNIVFVVVFLFFLFVPFFRLFWVRAAAKQSATLLQNKLREMLKQNTWSQVEVQVDFMARGSAFRKINYEYFPETGEKKNTQNTFAMLRK